MATSGTWAFDPTAGEMVINAYRKCGVLPQDLTAQHMADASFEANLLQVEWSNRQVNLFSTEPGTETLVADTATYTLPARLITILMATISTTDGSGNEIERVITPISTTTYQSYPNKAQSGVPTTYWLNRQAVPQITLWPVPDSNTTYTLNYRFLTQMEDAKLPTGATLDAPYRFLDAYSKGLSSRLAVIYAPDRAAGLKGLYDEAWGVAANQDTENVPMHVTPGLSGYYR